MSLGFLPVLRGTIEFARVALRRVATIIVFLLPNFLLRCNTNTLLHCTRCQINTLLHSIPSQLPHLNLFHLKPISLMFCRVFVFNVPTLLKVILCSNERFIITILRIE